MSALALLLALPLVFIVALHLRYNPPLRLATGAGFALLVFEGFAT